MPALICSLTIAESFFFFLGGISSCFFPDGSGCGRWGRWGVVGAHARTDQILATWVNDNSTGVSRPKIETSTLSFWASGLTSLMVAGSVANGPSITVTDSPTEKSTSVRTGAVPLPDWACAAFRGAAGARILTTSSTDNAEGCARPVG